MFIESLIASNFLSLGGVDYTFKDIATLIQGENLEDDDQESNGSGKSAFLVLLKYAIYGITPKDKLLKELIKFGEELTETKVIINCPIRKQKLVISREIRLKGSAKLTIDSIGGKSPEFSTVPDGNKEIIKWIGISKEDFENFYVIDGESYTSFITAPNAEKIDFISRFSNSKIIHGVWDLPKKEALELEGTLNTVNEDKIKSESRLEVYKDQLREEKSRDIDKEKEEEISKKKVEIAGHKAAIKILEDEKESWGGDVEKLTDKVTSAKEIFDELSLKLDNFKSSDLGDKKKKLFDKQQKANSKKSKAFRKEMELGNEKSALSNELEEINNILAGLITCPKCSHQFKIDEDVDVKELKSKKKKLKKSVEGKEKEIADAIADVDTLKGKVESITSKIDKIETKQDKDRKKKDSIRSKMEKASSKLSDLKQELVEAEGEITDCDNKIKSSKKVIGNLEDTIKSIKASKRSNQKEIDAIEAKIEKEKKEFKRLKKEANKIENSIFEVKAVENELKKFYSHLANQFIKVIQGYVNKNLKDMGSDLQISWEGYKVNGDGNLSEKITPYITRGGRVRSWGSFSKGERQRMQYANILANQEILNSTNEWGGLNFLFTDEVTEGTDAKGIGKLMKSLARKNFPIFVTTHVTDRNVHSNIMVIQKDQFGTSKIL